MGNIINNAIDSAEKSLKKKVWIFATDIGNEIIFEVEDSGAGIDERNTEILFEKGFTTKSEAGNIGYGLYLVKNSLEELGGYVTATNGKNGALFTVYIPK